jgi:hypothetical protein
MEHIICDTLIAMLIFDFLNVIRKLSNILYCNVRVLLWHCRSVVLLGETGVLGENHRPVASH